MPAGYCARMGWFSRKRWGVEHAVFAAASAATVVGGVSGNEKLQRIAKPLIAPALAVRVLRRSRDTDRADTALMVAGLAAATLGDIAMIRSDEDRRILSGAACFGVMQTAYSSILVRRGARVSKPVAVQRAGALAGAAGLLAARSRSVAAPLAGYGALLATTATLAGDPALAPAARVRAGLAVPDTDRRSWLGLGGLIFTLSDGSIVVRRTLLKDEKSRAAAEGFVLTTYAVAQLLLVEGILALTSRKG